MYLEIVRFLFLIHAKEKCHEILYFHDTFLLTSIRNAEIIRFITICVMF